MKFCVIGDSWAANTTPDRWHLDPIRHGAVDRALKLYGHTVDNFAQGGASNLGQLLHLEHEVLPKNSYDLILWFYTEPARDYTEFVSLDYGNDSTAAGKYFPDLTFKHFANDMTYINLSVLNKAKDITNTYNTPFVIIGGAGKVPNTVRDLDYVVWSLASWNQLICGIDTMPFNCYWHHLYKMLDHAHTYNKMESMIEIERLEKLESYMRTHPESYPDQHHPHVDLYQPLIEIMLQNI